MQADLDKIRTVAKMNPWAAPLRINVVKFAESHRTKSVVLEGESDTPHVMARTAFQIVYPDRNIMVESGKDF